ncbi:hypothetical protein [Rubrobacter indicoceani]|uniref:hypothetical protein n=1 Tax=Rubrobacter indicoceani TaxID=2051957 RepID=UPI0013C4C9D1|nr:hypothetical protein [Rubrobacter indicoceani]
MKKVALTAASLAMVAMTASPALAQDVDSTDNSVNDSFNDNSTNTQYCVQIVQQYNNVVAGDAVASGEDAVAVVAAENNASVEAVQNCVQGDGNVVGGATGGGTGVAVEGDDGDDGGAVSGGSGVSGVSEAGDDTASATYSVLPDTGGASLIALGAGALLVGGGLVARRIVR